MIAGKLPRMDFSTISTLTLFSWSPAMRVTATVSARIRAQPTRERDETECRSPRKCSQAASAANGLRAIPWNSTEGCLEWRGGDFRTERYLVSHESDLLDSGHRHHERGQDCDPQEHWHNELDHQQHCDYGNQRGEFCPNPLLRRFVGGGSELYDERDVQAYDSRVAQRSAEHLG